MNTAVKTHDRFITVDGLEVRYLEEGTGIPAILLHGASLGSSADVFQRNLAALAPAGIRAIAVDLPGHGKSDAPEGGGAPPAKFILRFMDALGLEKAALLAHSFAGNAAVSLGLSNPERVSHVMILGTGTLLPPLETGDGPAVGGREAAAQARLEERMTDHEPTLDDTRALLEANLFHHDLITDEELALRHQNSVGAAFQHFVARRAAAERNGAPPAPSTPLWQRLVELQMPLLIIYGRQDRARAEDRAKLLKERYPQLDLHLADGCKHLVPWDAADLFHELAVPFLKR